MEFRQEFRVFQIVSYQLNYIYKGAQTHRGYVWTIWKRLDSVLRLSKKFHEIPSKMPSFPEKLVTGKISLRYAMTHTQVYLDHLEPCLNFLKKAPRNVPRKIPSFRVFQNLHKYVSANTELDPMQFAYRAHRSA